MLLMNMYYGGQILNTSIGVDYDIYAACIFSADKIINIHDLKRQIHVSLKLLLSHFNITISARINTAPPGSGVFYSLFRIVSEEIWGIIETTAPYQIPGYKILELIDESEPISSFDHYNPCPNSIPESSNPIQSEERTHSRAREQLPSCVPVQNVDDDEEEEK
jgi:hypothetical protein